MNSSKKKFQTEVIFEVSNDPSGSVVIFHKSLNCQKKTFQTVVNHVDNLNDPFGKLVSAHATLKALKKKFQAEVIFEVSKEPVGKLVSAHLLLK
ncbi:hypothetical protein J5751_06005 [bacterium]|nr:hypothetical protein [bacterium]